MCLPYQHTDSPDCSSPPDSSSPPTVETQNPPLQLSYILQFSGATTSRPDAAAASTSRADAAASTSAGHGLSGLSGASTLSRNGFHEPIGASTSSGNGFYGPAGAAAMVLVKDVEDRDEHAVVLHRFRQGLGNQTISVAQYRGLILGLTESLRKGYTEITVQGNSELVVNQFLGNWEIDDPELRSLCDDALELRNSFGSFSIIHIDQNLSREVDDEAVRAISLPDGQIEEEPQPHA